MSNDPLLDCLLRPRRFEILWTPCNTYSIVQIPDERKSMLERIKEGLNELAKLGPPPNPEIHEREWGFFKQGRWLEGKGNLVIFPMPFGRVGISLSPHNDEVLKHILKEEGIVIDSGTKEAEECR